MKPSTMVAVGVALVVACAVAGIFVYDNYQKNLTQTQVADPAMRFGSASTEDPVRLKDAKLLAMIKRATTGRSTIFDHLTSIKGHAGNIRDGNADPVTKEKCEKLLTALTLFEEAVQQAKIAAEKFEHAAPAEKDVARKEFYGAANTVNAMHMVVSKMLDEFSYIVSYALGVTLPVHVSNPPMAH